MRVEIISVGRELLSGRTRDTNGPYMAGKLFNAGIIVERITLIDDKAGKISSLIKDAIGRNCQIIITTGGLGPTPDDVTLEGVARAAGVGLFVDPEAVKMVGDRYAHFYDRGLVPFPELSKDRLKMATVPEGCTLLGNRVGAAPGISIFVEEARVYSLPGVPAEMEDMFDRLIYPEILHLFQGGAIVVRHVRSRFGDESIISGIVKEVNRKYPSIYIKPKPSHFAKKLFMEVEFIASEKDGERESNIEEAVSYFQSLEEKWPRGF